MDFPKKFICATREHSTIDNPVPAPYLRRSFTLDKKPDTASLLLCGLGLYELYVNGERITKCPLAPYISAPDDIIYYDRYDLTPHLTAGENVIGVLLGNGMLNAWGAIVWDYQKAPWVSAPKLALRLELSVGGEQITLESDGQFKTAPSPILYDDLRWGEFYDARCEIPGWCAPGFDDTGWTPALPAELPRGEARLCTADLIVATHELTPRSVTPVDDGYLYDFGENLAGVCRLSVQGKPGQKIEMLYGEHLVDGRLTDRNIKCWQDITVQKETYICKGGEPESYTPYFTYNGFQYVFVQGIDAAQAVPELLTYVVMNSDLPERGGFACSDPVVNKLQDMTRKATLANFYYFPTDCPQREKNGWTGDAALSAEHTLLNLEPERSYAEWMHNIRKAQNEAGALPGIVPTGGWGFHWGNGPAWDCVLTYLPYYTYVYRGDEQILRDNATAIFRYVSYLTTRRDERGLLAIGLGDWCHTGRPSGDPKAPLVVTDTLISMDICQKAAYIFGVLDMELQRDFAQGLYYSLRDAARAYLLDANTLTVCGRCQTSQAMGLYYDLFEPGERQGAFARLLTLIEQADHHMDVGILGARVLFRVLSDFGRSDLAYTLITRPDFPSYGHWVAQGATTLWEAFWPEEDFPLSLNHHFFGDISAWFILHLAGIQYNPDGSGNCVRIAPAFIPQLDHASAFHIAPEGRIEVRWKRTPEGILLSVTLPEGMDGTIELPDGHYFPSGHAVIKAQSSEHTILCQPFHR